jgi:endonuclease/exonuclease/phosphatase family metal-dependent hydrolase
MTPPSLRVATYNVHKCRGLDGRINPERIASILHSLNADVIAIQEILDIRDGRPELDQVRRIAAQLSGYSFCFGENRTLNGGPYGNLTLSRFPVTTCHNYDVTYHKRERRGCLRTDVALRRHVGADAFVRPRELRQRDGQQENLVLHIFNVHLGTGFIERRHQARHLLSDKLLHSRELAGPRIVVGDFNEWTRGLASRLMGDAFEAVNPRSHLRYPRSYPGILPLLHLDHFYYDKHLALKSFKLHRSRAALVASDHLPMVAEFTVAESATTPPRDK